MGCSWNIERVKSRIELWTDLTRDDLSFYLLSPMNPIPIEIPFINLEAANEGDEVRTFIRMVYNEDFTYEDFINHILFLVYKDYYTASLPRNSFRDWERTAQIRSNPNEDPDVYRRKMNRALKSMLIRKEQDTKRLNTRADYIEQISHKTQIGHDKAESYHLTEIDIDAIESYSTEGLKLLDLLKKGTISSSKSGVSGEKIAEAYRQYLHYIQKAELQTDSNAWIKSLIELSYIETNCLPAFLYAVAKYMDAKQVSLIPKFLPVLCSCISFIQGMPAYGIESRFLHNRIKNIERFFDPKEELIVSRQFYLLLLMQYRVLDAAKDDSQIFRYLSEISPGIAKGYFEEHYNLFSDCKCDDWNVTPWSPSLIKSYRRVVGELTHDGHEKLIQTASKK